MPENTTKLCHPVVLPHVPKDPENHYCMDQEPIAVSIIQLLASTLNMYVFDKYLQSIRCYADVTLPGAWMVAHQVEILLKLHSSIQQRLSVPGAKTGLDLPDKFATIYDGDSVRKKISDLEIAVVKGLKHSISLAPVRDGRHVNPEEGDISKNTHRTNFVGIDDF